MCGKGAIYVGSGVPQSYLKIRFDPQLLPSFAFHFQIMNLKLTHFSASMPGFWIIAQAFYSMLAQLPSTCLDSYYDILVLLVVLSYL